MNRSRNLIISTLFAILAVYATAIFAEEVKPADSTVTPVIAKVAYPLDYCVVTGEKLGGMGAPVVYDYKGREIQFCCNGCVKTFEKDPKKYLKKIDEAIIAKEKKTYPLTTCVVTGEKLGGMGTPVDYVYNNQLVRFCCKGCISTFEKDPNKYLAMIKTAEETAKPK
jgi:YHS domain-containing protein